LLLQEENFILIQKGRVVKNRPPVQWQRREAKSIPDLKLARKKEVKKGKEGLAAQMQVLRIPGRKEMIDSRRL